MTAINGNPSAQNYAQSYGSAPVTYTPGGSAPMQNSYSQGDSFKSQKTGLLGGENKEYVNKKSVMMGVMGAAAGWFLAGGPVGIIVGALIGLALGVIPNIMKGGADKNNGGAVDPRINQQFSNNNTSQSQQYYEQQRMHQQMNIGR